MYATLPMVSEKPCRYSGITPQKDPREPSIYDPTTDPKALLYFSRDDGKIFLVLYSDGRWGDGSKPPPDKPSTIQEPPADYNDISGEERERLYERAIEDLQYLAEHHYKGPQYAGIKVHRRLTCLVSGIAIALNHGASFQDIEEQFWMLEEIVFCTQHKFANRTFHLNVRDMVRGLQNPRRNQPYNVQNSIPDNHWIGEERHDYITTPKPAFRQELMSCTLSTGTKVTVFLVGEWVQAERCDGEVHTMMGLDLDFETNIGTALADHSVNEPQHHYEPEAEYEAGGEPGHGMDRPHVSGSTLHRLLNPLPGLRHYDTHTGDL